MEISITNSGTIGYGIYATPSGGNSSSGVTFRLVGPLEHFVVLIKCPSNLHCLPSLPAVLWVIKDQIIFCYVSSQQNKACVNMFGVVFVLMHSPIWIWIGLQLASHHIRWQALVM